MKKKLLILIILVFVSCSKKNSTNKVAMTATKLDYQQIKQNDSRNLTDSIKKTFLDTLNTKESPVTIISARLFKAQYSDHKDIELHYKNTSRKNIKAIRFEWYCEMLLTSPQVGKTFL